MLGLFAGHDGNLGGCLFVLLRLQQGARVFQTNLGQWLAIDVFLHDGLGLWRFAVHHRQCQQRNGFVCGVQGLCLARGLQGAGAIVCLQTHAGDRGPGRSAQRGRCEVVGQCPLNRERSEFLVAGACKVARYCHEGTVAVLGFGAGHFAFDRVECFADPVQANQYLEHIAIGFSGSGDGLAPGARCGQRRVPRARLQGHLDGTLIKPGVVGFPCGIEQQRIGRSGLAIAGVEFAQQDLVKEFAIERRTLGGDRFDGGCLRVGAQRAKQQDWEQVTEEARHQTIIIHVCSIYPQCLNYPKSKSRG